MSSKDLEYAPPMHVEYTGTDYHSQRQCERLPPLRQLSRNDRKKGWHGASAPVFLTGSFISEV